MPGYTRDIVRYYRCDSASALEADNEIRTPLIAFGADGSHGYVRTNLDSLTNVSRLLVAYICKIRYTRRRKNRCHPLGFSVTRDMEIRAIQGCATGNMSFVPLDGDILAEPIWLR